MSKTVTMTAIEQELDTLLTVKATSAQLALTCSAMAMMTAPDEERRVWLRSREDFIDVLALSDRRLRQLWRRPADAGEVPGSDPLQWLPQALDAVATVGGVARFHEARYGATSVSQRLAGEMHASRGALIALDDLHRQLALEPSEIEVADRAETEGMVLRAARRVIRPRARGSEFVIGIAETPSYVMSRGFQSHTITVTPRWREVVRAVGTTTPCGAWLILDGWPHEEWSNTWHIIVARATSDGEVYVERLTMANLASRRRSKRAERAYATARRASEAAAAIAA